VGVEQQTEPEVHVLLEEERTREQTLHSLQESVAQVGFAEEVESETDHCEDEELSKEYEEDSEVGGKEVVLDLEHAQLREASETDVPLALVEGGLGEEEGEKGVVEVAEEVAEDVVEAPLPHVLAEVEGEVGEEDELGVGVGEEGEVGGGAEVETSGEEEGKEEVGGCWLDWEVSVGMHC